MEEMNPAPGGRSMLSGPNPHGASKDATLFSTSLPMLPHMKKQDSKPLDDASASFKDKHSTDWEGEDAFQFDEYHAIGSLLPEDEDELLAQQMDQLDFGGRQLGDPEEVDVFDSGGGLELESDAFQSSNLGALSAGNTMARSGLTISAGAVTGEHPFGEHPSRTLFVRNINSIVEDSELRSLFEPHGDIRSMYTACKHRGFVMISYYDIRAARNAKRLLHNKLLGRRNLDIHYSIPKENPSDKELNQGTLVVFNLDESVSNDDLRQKFGDYGEVKEIRETPYKRNHRFIEYYDIRAAEEALRSLNKCDIAGKRIKLELSHPGGARRNLMLQLAQGNEQDEPKSLGHQVGSLPGNLQQLGSSLEHSPLQSLSKSTHMLPPTSSASLSGLASLLDPLFINYAPVSPISKGSMWGNQLNYLDPLWFPERNSSLYSGAASSFDASSYNSSVFETLSEPQSIWRSSKLYPEPHRFATSRGRSIAHHFTANAPNNGFSFSSHGPSFGSSSGLQHHHDFPGSAPSGFPIQRHFSFYQEPLETLIKPTLDGMVYIPDDRYTLRDLSGFGNLSNPGNASEGASLGFQMMAFPYGPLVGVGHPEGFTAYRGARPVETSRNQMDCGVQFLLDLRKIESGEDFRTTLMIKNIPNKYTSKMMMTAINENHSGTYDFFYLPIDFKNKCNVGYAFINMLAPVHIIPFYKEFNGKRWEKFHSEKVASLAYARIQGKAALLSHFQNSSLMNEDKRYRPVLLDLE